MSRFGFEEEKTENFIKKLCSSLQKSLLKVIEKIDKDLVLFLGHLQILLNLKCTLLTTTLDLPYDLLPESDVVVMYFLCKAVIHFVSRV